MWEIWVWSPDFAGSELELAKVNFEEKDIEFYLRSFPDSIYFYRMVM